MLGPFTSDVNIQFDLVITELKSINTGKKCLSQSNDRNYAETLYYYSSEMEFLFIFL